jgi:hypothetical protein
MKVMKSISQRVGPEQNNKADHEPHGKRVGAWNDAQIQGGRSEDKREAIRTLPFGNCHPKSKKEQLRDLRRHCYQG